MLTGTYYATDQYLGANKCAMAILALLPYIYERFLRLSAYRYEIDIQLIASMSAYSYLQHAQSQEAFCNAKT